MKTILLTFDIEEFDLPKEFDQNIDDNKMYHTSLQGLTNLLNLLNNHNIKSTFFITANFAKKFPKIIKQLSNQHEIASHSLSHSEPLTFQNIKQAKLIKEKIINKPIKGFRAPRWDLKNTNIIEQAEFNYDSSSHPIYLPGRYFNINKNRHIHKLGNLIEIPLSTLPPNLSLFWLAFKNFPLTYAKLFTKLNFINSNYTMLLMHPWEFTDISKFKLPNYIKKVSGKKLLIKLNNYIKFCIANNYNFRSVEDYLRKYKFL